MDKPNYKLTLTEEQAKIVSTACEVYARIRMGQFQEIIWNAMSVADMKCDDFCDRRDNAERCLLEARKYLLPELHGWGHSYGMGKFEDADKAFDVHQVLRHAMGDERPPFSYYDLPKVEKEGG